VALADFPRHYHAPVPGRFPAQGPGDWTL
jgi:hypothetical protein